MLRSGEVSTLNRSRLRRLSKSKGVSRPVLLTLKRPGHTIEQCGKSGMGFLKLNSMNVSL